jgi:hypothetical protein
MLVTELSVTNDGAEFFGFWYWKRMEPPEPGEARCGFFWDLMVGECRQLRLRGSAKQIRETLLVAGALTGWPPDQKRQVREALRAAEDHLGVSIGFEDVGTPRGTSIPVDATVRVTESEAQVIAKLQARTDVVQLDLAPDWSALGDLRESVAAHELRLLECWLE